MAEEIRHNHSSSVNFMDSSQFEVQSEIKKSCCRHISHSQSHNRFENMGINQLIRIKEQHYNPVYTKIHGSKNKAFRKTNHELNSLDFFKKLEQKGIRAPPTSKLNAFDLVDETPEAHLQKVNNICINCNSSIIYHKNQLLHNQNPLKTLFRNDKLGSFPVKSKQSKPYSQKMTKKTFESNLLLIDHSLKSIMQAYQENLALIKLQISEYCKYFQECTKIIVQQCKKVLITKEQTIFKLQLELINAEDQLKRYKQKKMKKSNSKKLLKSEKEIQIKEDKEKRRKSKSKTKDKREYEECLPTISEQKMDEQESAQDE